jgi:alpha-N-acetylglucosaminidase
MPRRSLKFAFWIESKLIMRRKIYPVLLIFCISFAAATAQAQNGFVDSADALIARVLPQHAKEFSCEIISVSNGKDVFEIEPVNGKIVLRGNNGVSLAMAFSWYLRYDAHTSYDWQASGPIDYPDPLPIPTEKVRNVCVAPERFFLNYCTFGYTFPFTDFAGWQRFIDWMAMNGINRPLLQCGQDAVWYRVWKSYGLSDQQIRGYFTGPAHLPWHHMANIDKWGGPLPMSYIDGQMKLQQQILASVRSLGMTPILCGFAGHVPEALKSVKPDATITHIPGNWGGFDSEWTTWFLDPKDPLFKQVQQRLFKEQTALYGTDHLYAADPFNEITPPSWDGDYLAGVAKSIYEGMEQADPKAIWYQMAWTFYYDRHWLKKPAAGITPFEALCKGVPLGRMIFLDYYCEQTEIYPKTQNFYGAPFIWDYLGNFGGCTYMSDPIKKVASRIAKALPIANCRGVGSTLEGLNVNPMVYELALEQPWHADGKVDFEKWAADYGARRGGGDPAVVKAWQILTDKVLTAGNELDAGSGLAGERGCALTLRPQYSAERDAPTSQPEDTALNKLPVSATTIEGLTESADWLFTAARLTQACDGYQYDAVNIVRQLMAYQADNIKARMVTAYHRKDLAGFRAQGKNLLDIGHDLDTLLGTRHEYLLGAWIHDARAWGATPTEADYYEHSARQILTTWGGPGAPLTDYARREFNGLLVTYYLRRWQEFIHRLDDSLTNDKPFDSTTYLKWCIDFEGKWVDTTGEKYAIYPSGDPVATARAMLQKYRAR